MRWWRQQRLFKVCFPSHLSPTSRLTLSWRRQWHPTPVLLPGKPHGWRSLVGGSPWGRTESDTTERLHFHFSLSLFTFMHWRRQWQPAPVILPGESQGQESLVGCCLWGLTESDTTEVTQPAYLRAISRQYPYLFKKFIHLISQL